MARLFGVRTMRPDFEASSINVSTNMSTVLAVYVAVHYIHLRLMADFLRLTEKDYLNE